MQNNNLDIFSTEYMVFNNGGSKFPDNFCLYIGMTKNLESKNYVSQLSFK